MLRRIYIRPCTQQTQKCCHNVVTMPGNWLCRPLSFCWKWKFCRRQLTTLKSDVAKLWQRNSNVVTMLQSRNFIKCLTTSFCRYVNAVSANIYTIMCLLSALRQFSNINPWENCLYTSRQTTLNSVNIT